MHRSRNLIIESTYTSYGLPQDSLQHSNMVTEVPSRFRALLTRPHDFVIGLLLGSLFSLKQDV